MWKFLIVSMTVLILGGVSSAADQLIDKEVEIRVSQGGFAGVTGTVFTVDKLGNWSAVDFTNDELKTGQQRSGALSPEETDKLVELLNNDLSSSSAKGAPVNAKKLELRYGELITEITLPAGADTNEGVSDRQPGWGIQTLAAWFEDTIDKK